MGKNAKPVVPSIGFQTTTTATVEKKSINNFAMTLGIQSQSVRVGVVMPSVPTLQSRVSHSGKPLPPKPFYCGLPNWSGQLTSASDVPDRKLLDNKRGLPEIPQSESTVLAEELINNGLLVSSGASSSWELCIRCNNLPDSELALPVEVSEQRVSSAIELGHSFWDLLHTSDVQVQ
jgi:hypothetical protein